MQVLYTAAHGVPGSEAVPLGGGAAISRWLVEEWSRTKPFPLRLIAPQDCGGESLVDMDEHQYARFCRAFEKQATSEIMRHDPRDTVVLANDISEGPSFRRIADAGFRIVTIFHVDVVAYIADIYLKGWLRPETTVRWHRRFAALPMPDLLRLVWEKQRECVRCSKLLVMPSQGMKEVVERCYGAEASEKILLLPWGVRGDASNASENIRAEFGVPRNAFVLLTLSRISPEKGQDLLLEALLQWERSPDFPQDPVYLFVCGAPAFMRGERHLARLRELAAMLRRIKVIFPGFVTGERKQAFFEAADLYVFPSRHESYGLTLMEAFQAGLPAVCTATHGAREVLRPECGLIANSKSELWKAIAKLQSNPEQRHELGKAAKSYAAQNTFSTTAQRLADALRLA